MKVSRKDLLIVLEAVLNDGFAKATKILGADKKVTVSKKTNTPGAYVLTIGGPNYAEREYIAKRKAKGLSFKSIILVEGK